MSILAWGLTAVVLAVVIAAAVVCAAKGINYGIISRDAVQVARIKFYTGYLSSFGTVLMCAAATGCFMAALAVPPRPREGVTRGFLLASGLLTAILLVDDLFLMHERFFPMLLGVPEWAVMVFYMVSIPAYVIYYRAQLLRTRVLPLVFALICFAAAQFCDWVLDGKKLYILEDGPKLIGYGAWCGYFLDVSVVRIRGAVAAAERGDRDDAHDAADLEMNRPAYASASCENAEPP